MKSARDIRRADKLQHRGVVTDREGAEALPHIAVEIDFPPHGNPSKVVFVGFTMPYAYYLGNETLCIDRRHIRSS
ncbi:hypothetical protein [Mesorhizobium sp. CAU 1732]|uniref:hypothetical protein n=1 Tax=Mesorhizobium sp. CAU 1732 TaxID=3140358 RepID=UPI0032609038